MHTRNEIISKPPLGFGVNTPRQPMSREQTHGSRGDGMRVLMVVESCAGGTGRHVLDLAECLIARGCEVHLVHSTERVDQMFLERMGQLHALRRLPLPMRTSIHFTDLALVRAVHRYIDTAGPFDVVHGHSSKGGAVARLAALGRSVPVVYTLHGLIMMDPGLSQWKWLLYLGIELGMSLRTRRIIAVSPEEARAARRLGLGHSRVITVPNGIGPIELAGRQESRRRLGVTDDNLLVGFVGRLVSQKAPEVLVRAFAGLARVAPRARLVMVGAGPLEASLRGLAEELHVGEKVLWMGECDARGVLAAFDLFALSSRKEGLPYVVLEAMAAGVPVVATSSAGVEILVDTGVNGAVVPPDDSDAFAAALIDLATDPVRRIAYGRAALERASEFTLDLMVERTLEAYRAPAKEGTAP